jgi:NADH:ubiquinone oxidoreductase subunit E
MKKRPCINVELCMGSACFVRGNRKVAAAIRMFLAENGLIDRVRITGALCGGRCGEGPTVTINGTIYRNRTAEELITRLRELMEKE